ncbi:unnamed protein product [Eretmochelys imbricata]
MRESLWLFLCALPLFPGSVAGNSLTQIPASLSATEGQRVEIRCQYSTSYSSYALDWYQERPGKEPLFLLGRYSYGLERKSDSVAPRFSAQLDTGAKSLSLSIDGAQRADSAVYFCALWDPPTVGGWDILPQ